MYTIHSVIRCIYGLPLADGEVTHADMYHDVEVLIVDVNGVKLAYPVHLISLYYHDYADLSWLQKYIQDNSLQN